MKILFFIGNLRSGGKERRLVELIKSINKKKCDIEFKIVLIRNVVHYKDLQDLKIPIKYFVEEDESKNSFSIYYRLFKFTKDYKPDIIHSWGSEETFYVFSIAKLLHIKLINSQITEAPNKIKWISRFGFHTKINFQFSNINLANSYAGLKSYGIEDKKNSFVIYNGFDFDRISNLITGKKIKKKFSINTKYVVAMVASFSDKKDYSTYIKAAIKVLENRKDITFLCVGSGDDLPYKKIIPIEIINNIKFLGRQEDVESIMNIVDIGVLSTYTEGISNAIMEFMALAKPVIATDGGGTKELVIDGETGFLIEQRNIEELTEKILHLINDNDLRKRLGGKGYDRIINEFLIDKKTDAFLKLYDDIIRKS